MNNYFKHFLVATLLLFVVSNLNAQVSIDSSNINASPGMTYTKQGATSVEVDLGEAGENQSWDFSGIEGEIEYHEYCVEPEGRPGAESFPDANLCWYQEALPGAWEVNTYANLNEENFYFLGMTAYVPPPLDTLFATPVECIGYIYNFPMQYGDEWDFVTISDFQGTITTDSVHCVIDAWGTVTDVAGEFPCLRLQKFSHSTKVEGEEIEIDTGWEYVWIAPDFGAIVLIDSEENEENPDFSMGTFNRTTAIGGVGVSSQVKSEIPSRSGLDSAYPNPFNPQTQLKFTVAQPGVVYIVIYDVNGKVISSVVDGFLNVGTYKTDFYATGLVSGVYFAKFSTGSFNQTQMLILNK